MRKGTVKISYKQLHHHCTRINYLSLPFSVSFVVVWSFFWLCLSSFSPCSREQGGFRWVSKADFSLFRLVFAFQIFVFFWFLVSNMERDFLGLSSKEPLAVVKEEIHIDGCKDLGMFLLYAYFNWILNSFHYFCMCI